MERRDCSEMNYLDMLENRDKFKKLMNIIPNTITNLKLAE